MRTEPLPPPSYMRRGPHEPWLLRSSPPAMHVLSSACAMCGKMRASVAAVLAHPDAAPQPNLFCVAQSVRHPLLTARVADRAHLWDGGHHYTGGIALLGSRWAMCLGLPPPVSVLPVPTWAMRLPAPDAPRARPEPVSFWVLGNNLAGAAHHRDIVGPLIEAVDPSFVMLQETWDPTAAQALVPPTYALVQGAVTGQGRGLAVGIRLADILPMHPPAVVYDSRDWLGVLCHARHVGRVLLMDAHFDPHASHAQWCATMDSLLTCAHHVRAAVTIIEGDLNSTDDGAAPRAVTLRRDPRLQGYVRVLPPRMPTNFVSIQGRIRATAIDHLFVSGPVRSSEHHLVPTASSHLAVLADISLTSTRYAPFHWKHLRWRLAPPTVRDAVRALTSAAWGHLAVTSASPNTFIAALHHLARQRLPAPMPDSQYVRRLARHPPPYDDAFLRARAEEHRQRAQELHRDRVRLALRTVHIGRETRRALCLPTVPLRPYTGILPSPGAVLPSREERLAEVTAQVSYATRYRHLRIDKERFAIQSVPPMRRRTPWFAAELPMDQLHYALRRGRDPDASMDREALLADLNARPLYDTQDVARQLERRTSPATALDNVPGTVTHVRFGGTVAGVRNMHCSFQRNVDSVARDTIRYGSYKGKGPLHLAGSHRPVAVESDLMRSYSGVGRTRLNYTLELSGALTPDLYAYRSAVSATMMVLTTRASVLRAMELSGVCADAEWDESDAYLRNQREDDEELLHLLPGVWNFGTWCDAFYSRQRIHPVTDEGLAPCYSPGEGREQGDSFAGEGFQALQCVLNTCMLAGATLSIPDVLRPGHSLPMEHQAYSDDRRFQSATMERMVELVARCMDVSTAAGRVVHPAKLAFHYVRLDAMGPRLVECEVGLAGLMTTMETPEVLRVPILADLPLTVALGRFLQALRRASAAATRHQLPPLLRLRAMLAYGVSSGDNLLRGLLVPSRSLAAHQVQVHKPYRRAYCLPKWTPVQFLTLALEEGGPGAPSLRDRCELLLMQSYLQSSWSRNAAAASAVHYLVSTPPIRGWEHEGIALQGALRERGVILTALPSGEAHTGALEFGSLAALNGVRSVVISYDGGYVAGVTAWAMVMWHDSLGFFYGCGRALRTAGSGAAVAEWMGRLEALHALGRWSGTVHYVADSTNTLASTYDRAPPAGTLVGPWYRVLAPLRVSSPSVDVWVPSRARAPPPTPPLMRIHRAAHDLAKRAAQRPSSATVPWPHLLAGRVVAHWDGALIMNVKEAAQGLYQVGTRMDLLRRYPAARIRPWHP